MLTAGGWSGLVIPANRSPKLREAGSSDQSQPYTQKDGFSYQSQPGVQRVRRPILEWWAWLRKDGGARGSCGSPGFRGPSAPRVSVGVGNGGIWENYLCTGDMHCAEAIVAPQAREEGRKLSWELEGLGACFSGDWPLTPVPSRSLEP